MKAQFNRDWYIHKGARMVQGPGDAVIYEYESNGTPYAQAFSGKRAKPDWHYRFRSEEHRQTEIEAWFKRMTASQAYKAEYKAKQAKERAERPKTAAQVYARCLAEVRAGNDKAYLQTFETAILVRDALARRWPEVKFSVKSDSYSGGSSVDVHWNETPGVDSKEVDALCDRYEGAGFDGMIDLKYHVTSWLSPEGEMTLAHTGGTAGSMGSVSEAIGDPPHPQAVMVWGGADYVMPSCHRIQDQTQPTL